MSNALAIATVTRTLAQVVRTAVQSVVAGSDVLTSRPDAAATAEPRARLFLYQVSPNAALRNNDLPTRAANGTLTSRPTAALDLHYLLSFYGNETELEPQRMLGAAVRDLHAQPVLLRQMIQDAIAAAPFLTNSNLPDAVEQIKFTPMGLSLEELSKLWSVFFQAPYALSVAYLGTVVLIESAENAPAALPVLRRGKDDRGVDTQLGPFPILEDIHVGVPEDAGRRPRLPSLPVAQLGTLLRLTGSNLGGDIVRVQFDHTRLPIANTIVVPAAQRSATELTCMLPDDVPAQTAWAPGLYTVAVVVQHGADVRMTNQAPLPLAARVTDIAPPSPVARDANNDATLTITCNPQVRPSQRAMLLVGDREVLSESHPADTDTLVFIIRKAAPVSGALVRLRIDGVDSLPFARVEQPPPPHMVFDDAQRVTNLMNDRTAWHTANDAYLAAALLWLRLRLQRLAEAHRVPTDATPPATSRGFWSRGREEAAQESVAPRRLPDPTGQIEQAATALQKAVEVEPPPALVILNRRLGLGTFEGQILLLCAAMELDTRIGPLCAQAQGDARPYPTFALALALFDDPVWEALSPERPLRHWRLIEINQPAAQPLTISALRADERVVSYLKGLNYVDDRLTPFLTPLPDASEVLPPTHQRYVDLIVQDLHAGQGLPVVHLLGGDVASKQVVASHVGARLELEVFRLSADMLPGAWADLETLARLWQRESYLSPVALFLDAHDAEKELPAVSRFLGRTSGLVFLDTRDPWPQSARDELAFEIDRPSSDEQRAIWSTLLGDTAGDAPQRLAGQFTLSQAQIQRVSSLGSREGEPAFDRIWQACVVASRPRLDTLAQRLEVKALSWDDLVLPREEKALLRQIMDQVGQRHHVYETWGFGRRMSRGLGISALFAGESGTGKTLAAEVIAGELQLNLYRIDLSQVVSKYIGETEKNLRKLFDAAEDGGSILFFDEADALFGKRSEVKDSHDRYANIEINYLLQRMDVYRGLAILATNMKGALDTAFMRRLRFVVNFPFPGVPERQRIWARAFPDQAETDGLDYARLARLNLTGGSIQNIAVNAAFLAARADSPITMALIADAVRGEFRKLDKPVNEADFRMLFRDVVTV